MNEEPKPPDGAAVVAELRQALDAADRCIELAKLEAARADASLRAQSEVGAGVEQVFLANARKRREQLASLDLRMEVPPSPPEEQAPRPPPPGIEAPREGDLAEVLLVGAV